MESLKDHFAKKNTPEKIDFLQPSFFNVVEKSSEKELNTLLQKIVLDSSENTYVQKLALERLMDLIFLDKLKPRHALSILIDNWDSIELSLNTLRIKSLYYLYDYEEEEVIKIYEQYLSSEESELVAEAFFHLGLVNMQLGMASKDKNISLNALEKSKLEFTRASLAIENRSDAILMSKIIGLTINVFNSITSRLRESLKEICEILFTIESYSFNFKNGPYYIGFYRVLNSLVNIAEQKPLTWLDFRTGLSSLFKEYASIKDQEIKDRLSLSHLSNSFSEKLKSDFFQPFFALNFSAEKSRITARLGELPLDSPETTFLQDLLALIDTDSKKKITVETLIKQLKLLFPLVSDPTLEELEERYSDENIETKLFKIYKDLSKASLTQVDDHILRSCLLMQSNRNYYGNYSEDDRNTFIASMLESAGYLVKDQTRRSRTETGKSAGEIDILIQDSEYYPISIIEALNLESVNRSYIITHINKIFTYDANGLSDNYILVYANVKKFGVFYKNYLDFVEAHDFEYPLVDLREDSVLQYTEIRKFTIVHNRNEKKVNMHHVLINLSDSGSEK
jgi:hypothetical protein